jgi:hypothetical protein
MLISLKAKGIIMHEKNLKGYFSASVKVCVLTHRKQNLSLCVLLTAVLVIVTGDIVQSVPHNDNHLLIYFAPHLSSNNA